MNENPTFDDMIEFSDYPLIQNIVNDPKLTAKIRLDELKKWTKPQGGYKKKTVEHHIQISQGEIFLLCVI